jgi:D-alanyl-D-alanine carboxypeptidase
MTLLLVIASCADEAQPSSTKPSTTQAPVTTLGSSTSTSVPAAESGRFPAALFAGLGDKPISDELSAELQRVLEASANGDGLTAAVISPQGTWNGATGMASTERVMAPNDQMGIGSITKTPVAAQVMQLIEAGELALNDLAADHLPPDLEFDTNGATIDHLLSHRSGISEYFLDEDELRAATMTDPLRVWTLEEKLATVASERSPVGGEWVYTGTNYLLLGLIIEQITGRSLADVLRTGVLAGDGYERLIYQPDERPTEPMAMPSGASHATFAKGGGYLPSLANATMFTSEGAIASDAMSLARWFRGLCAGQVVSAESLDEMTDFAKRPAYGLGIWDRRDQYGYPSGALGHTGLVREGYRTAAMCFHDPGIVVVAMANAEEHDIDTTTGNLWQAASN